MHGDILMTGELSRAQALYLYQRMSTVSRLLPLPVLVQLEHVEEDLTRQAALTTTIELEQRGRGL